MTYPQQQSGNGRNAPVGKPVSAPASPVDWSGVPFDVPCGRCGADLKNATGARCPGCGLEFDPEQLIPIDRLCCLKCGYRLFGLSVARCPECGTNFNWDDVLAAARSPARELFEYRWISDPVPSLARTWWLAAFRPRTLWSHFDIHDRPRVAPLLLFAALQWLLFAVSWPALAPAAERAMVWLVGFAEVPIRFTYSFRVSPGFLTHLAWWYWLTFAALQMFVLSKRLYRIRWLQILRVYVHATAFASFAILLWFAAEWLVDLAILAIPALRGRFGLGLYDRIGLGVGAFALLVTWRRIWQGYAYYLKVPGGWGTAAMALTLGYLLQELVRILN